MPFWLTWVFSIVGKHFFRVLMYGSIILGIGFFLYSAFLKPTNTTTIQSGGKVINNFESPRQDLFSFGCSNLKAEIYWKKKQNSNQVH